MYNPNYGSSSSSSHQQPTSAPFSSTPSNVRPQRPRFGFPGPAAYPRPRSSASKPNPECYSESRGQYGYSEDYLDNMGNKYPMTSDYGNVYSDEYLESESYGSVSENCMNTPRRCSFGNSDAYVESMRGTIDSMVNNYTNSPNDTRLDTSLSPMHNSSQNSTAYFTCNESFYESPKRPLFVGNLPASPLQYSPSKFPQINSGYNADNRSDFQGWFQNKKDKFKADSSLAIKSRGPRKKAMASKSEWRCTVCCMDFTSSIPYDMHLRGAKHAKKLKLQDALQSIQSQVAQSKEIAPLGKSFRCELCNITANSSLQLQTHLEGTKHKNKLSQLQQSKEKITEKDAEAALEVNGKSNGAAIVRPLPAEFGEPQQTKMCKFSCDICNLILNSEIQLQQHLASKKHQAKVEGKPYNKKKLKRKNDDESEEKTEQKTVDNATETSAAIETATQESATNDISEAKNETSNIGEARKMVVGVKTLSACFVQGDTLQ
ncbi:zinc finger RNA-binding protein-like isoform X2 [Argiope bruennichi]|nr:zinc finger RNA-binding protein-like isoform X2 [Argiope bruennichi]XP_055937809.1 zinc finger RNA-binding protein-like isoform X2 [Argiope bruennichi]